ASRRPSSRRCSGSGRSPPPVSLPESRSSSSASSVPGVDADGAASLRCRTRRRNGANALCGAYEVVLERPDRRRSPAANAGLLVDVLNMVSDRLDGDAEIVGDLLVRLSAHEHEEDLQFAPGETGRQVSRTLP